MPAENVAVPENATPAQVEEALRSSLATGGGRKLPPVVRLAQERNIDVLVERFQRVSAQRRMDQRVAELARAPFAGAETSIGRFRWHAPPLTAILASIEQLREQAGFGPPT